MRFPNFFRSVVLLTVFTSWLGSAYAGPGAKMYDEFEENGQIYPDSAWQEYVGELGEKLLDVSSHRGKKYHFYVLDNSQINAFATPDAYIFVNRGLIAFLSSEEQLAAVIGHEIGHVVGEHSMKRMSKARVINGALNVGSILGSIFIGRETTENALLVADLASTGILLNYSRSDELEADRLGIQQMHDAGINPIGSQQFFEKLSKKDNRQSSGIEQLLSTHPATNDRVKQAAKLIKKLPVKTYSPILNNRFEAVKKLLPSIEE